MKAFQLVLFKAILCSLFVILVIVSCTKKPEAIGLDLVDADKFDVLFDTTLDVYAYSFREDTVRTDETTVNLLGSQITETFGLTKTSFYTQLRLSAFNPDFGENPTVDSAVFTLVYSGYYGNINTQQTVFVHQLLDSISYDEEYYSDSKFNADTLNNFAEHSFLPSPNDSLIIDSAYLAAELRIPLNQAFIDTILNRITIDSTLSSSEEFISSFPGLYVTTESETDQGEGAICYFNLLNSRSNVTIYYNGSSSYIFTINSSNARVGQFAHDYSLSTNQAFKDQIIGGDTSLGNENLFLQGLAGVQTKITFPDLKSWAESGNYSINQARLVMPVSDYEGELEPPASLLLFKLDKNGGFDFLQDLSQGETYFGGNYNPEQNNYWFRVSFHIQSLLTTETDYGLIMYPNAKSVKANGVDLSGTGDNLLQRMKLELIYTDLN